EPVLRRSYPFLFLINERQRQGRSVDWSLGPVELDLRISTKVDRNLEPFTLLSLVRGLLEATYVGHPLDGFDYVVEGFLAAYRPGEYVGKGLFRGVVGLQLGPDGDVSCTMPLDGAGVNQFVEPLKSFEFYIDFW